MNSAGGGPQADLVCVGEVLLDFIAPDAESLSEADRFVPSPGGAPANVAVAAARMGARSAFVGAVGQDPFGDYLSNILVEHGVDTTDLLHLPERTTLAFVARNLGGIPDFMFYRGADAALRDTDIPADLIASSGAVYLSSMALLSSGSAEATLHAAAIARRAGTLICVDPNLRPSSWPSLEVAREAIDVLIEQADVLKVNDGEARLLTGRSDLHECLEVLAGGGRLTVITLGAEGCLWRLGDRTGNVASPAVQVTDTTGAGDAFMGALLAELTREAWRGAPRLHLDTEHLVRSLQVACAAGALSCSKPGAMTSLPARQDVECVLAG
jgi:fructokinase